MPFDEKKIVNRNGKKYYWNKENKKVIEATIKEIEVKNCPADVIIDLLSLNNDDAN